MQSRHYALFANVAGTFFFSALALHAANIGYGNLQKYPLTNQTFLYWLVTVLNLCFLGFIAVLFFVRSRPVPQETNWGATIMAYVGSFIPFVMINSVPSPFGSQRIYVSSLLLAVGFAGQMWAVLKLGKSFSIVPAARKLVVSGVYKRWRHPLYFFEMMSFGGTCIYFGNAQAALIWSCFVIVQMIRAGKEEEVLGRVFPEYATYKAQSGGIFPRIWK
ncbi:MAG: methyltransferase [Verrucomicrobiota bacterium]|nr:methyltransferase [Verrucomicrobiota bacterium]